MSRRFVAKTAAQLAAWQTVALDDLDLVGLLIDTTEAVQYVPPYPYDFNPIEHA